MKVDLLLHRAKSALGKKTKYVSPGTTPPLNAAAWPDSGGEIDCSGFVCWCLGISRKADHPLYVCANGGWFDTYAIHKDGRRQVGYFSAIDTAEPGAFVVYPDRNGHNGHIGIVTDATGALGVSGIGKVIHSSAGNWRKYKDAIRETDGTIWAKRPDSLLVWYDSLER